MTRVGIIANTFETTIGALAGGHVHFLEVAKRWTDLDVWVFAPAVAAATVARELPRATFVAMPSIDGFVRNKQIRYLARTLLSVRERRALRSCDVLLATSHFLPDVVPALFAKRGRFIACIPHVLDPPSIRAGNVIPNALTTVLQAASLAVIGRFAPAVLLNDDATAETIGIDRKRTDVSVMTHGIEHVTGDVTESRAAFANDESHDGRHVVFLGRLVPTKGVDDLLEAWATVVRDVPAARLTIAGGGEPAYARQLHNIARERGIEASVFFAGRVGEEDKRTLLASAGVFAFPSKEEGWGIAVAEAMAYGLPCVTYDLPAYRKPFPDGRLAAPVGDTNAFARLLVDVLSDDGTRARLADEARARSSDFSWAKAAAIERDAIDRLVRH